MTDFEDIAEELLTAISPGSPMFGTVRPDFAVQDLGIACGGMPSVWYSAAMYRVLGDQQAYADLWSRLAGIALSDSRKAVRKRAGLLASLVLVEDRSGGMIETIGLTATLLRCHRSAYYRDLRGAHLDLRARLDTWARSGLGWIARKAR